MLHADALRLIQETAVNAAGVSIVRIEGEPRRVFIDSNGKFEKYDLPAPTIKAEVVEVDDLIRLAIADGVPKPRSLWHHYESVVLVLDDSDRRDTVKMPLPKTNLFQWLERTTTQPQRVDQRTFLTLLKQELAEAVSEMQLIEFVSVLQAIKFRKSDETDSDLSRRGTEGLGRKIEQECTGADKLPEFLEIKAQIYRNLPEIEPAVVKVYVSIDFEKQQFVLTPCGDRVAEAVDGAQAILGDILRERIAKAARKDGQPIQVYFGKP